MRNNKLINYVNSFHNYQIKNKPNNFDVLGISKDKQVKYYIKILLYRLFIV